MYSFFLKKIVMPLSYRLSKNKGWQYYQKYIDSEYHSLEDRKRRQWEKLKRILHHAYYNVPFYRRKFDEANIKPENVKTKDDFKKIPITTKRELMRNFPQNVIAKNYSLKNLRFSNTSGASGRFLMLANDHEDINHKYAAKLRSRYLMGVNIGESILRISPNECQPCLPDGTSPSIGLFSYLWTILTNKKYKSQAYYIFMEKKLVNPLLHRRKTLSPLGVKLHNEDLRWYIEMIKKYNPRILTGYPLYLYLLARYMEENSISPFGCKVVDLTGGSSTKWMRDFIGEKFGAPVYQIYGSCEFGRVASECQQSLGLMHILEDFCYVEFIKNTGEEAKPKELANIIITSLTNYAMPLIRYECQDVGWYDLKSCGCGRTTKLMYVEGRLQDLIITNDGKVLTTHFFLEKFLNYPGIRLFQLLQYRGDRFEFRIVRRDNANIDTVRLKNILYELLGKRVQIEINFTDYIKPQPSGKYRLVRSSTYEKFRCIMDPNF